MDFSRVNDWSMLVDLHDCYSMKLSLKETTEAMEQEIEAILKKLEPSMARVAAAADDWGKLVCFWRECGFNTPPNTIIESRMEEFLSGHTSEYLKALEILDYGMIAKERLVEMIRSAIEKKSAIPKN